MSPLDERLVRRAAEKRLARELQEAHEAYRLSCLTVSDTIEPGPGAGSNLPARNTGDKRGTASTALERAQARWKEFVINGVIPDDLLNIVKDDLS